MLKSCKRLKYVKFIVLIVKKNLWTSEVLFTKKQSKNTHIKVPILIVLMQLTIQVHIWTIAKSNSLHMKSCNLSKNKKIYEKP
jgi:hypothetical protein